MANTPSTPAPPTTSLPPGLNADAIDVVPILTAILSRIPDLTSAPLATAAGSPPAEATPSQISGTGTLAYKNIVLATDEMKHKLQNARRQIKELPDVDRTLKEQEEEIRQLEDKIRRQRSVLGNLRKTGLLEIGEKAAEDVFMGGTG